MTTQFTLAEADSCSRLPLTFVVTSQIKSRALQAEQKGG